MHAVQNARKEAGLDVEDRIDLVLRGDEGCSPPCASTRDYVAGETLAATLNFDGTLLEAAHTERARIEGSELEIALRRAG